MKKKILAICIIGMFLLTGLSVSAMNIKMSDTVDSVPKINMKNPLNDDPPFMYPIEGPDKVTYYSTRMWKFGADDDNALFVQFIIDWGDGTGTVTHWIFRHGPAFKYMFPYIAFHSYERPGSCTIEAYAMDKEGTESNHVYLTITVTTPRNKIATNNILLSKFERFPNLFPILQRLIQQLGL